MQGYQKFQPSGDWDRDIKTYRLIAEGHVGRYSCAIEQKKSHAPKGSDGSRAPEGRVSDQLARLHRNELASLEDHHAFWQRQLTASHHDVLLEADGREADGPEWCSTHQSLRAQAARFGRSDPPRAVRGLPDCGSQAMSKSQAERDAEAELGRLEDELALVKRQVAEAKGRIAVREREIARAKYEQSPEYEAELRQRLLAMDHRDTFLEVAKTAGFAGQNAIDNAWTWMQKDGVYKVVGQPAKAAIEHAIGKCARLIRTTSQPSPAGRAVVTGRTGPRSRLHLPGLAILPQRSPLMAGDPILGFTPSGQPLLPLAHRYLWLT